MKTILIPILAFILISCFVPTEPAVVANPGDSLTLLWEYEYDQFGFGSWLPPGFVGDSLIIMTGDEYITCLRTDNGTMKWRYDVPGDNASSMHNLVHNESYLFGWQNGSNYPAFAVNISTGLQVWSIDSIGFGRYHCASPSYIFTPYGHRFFKLSFEGEVLDSATSAYPFRSISYYSGRIYGAQGWSAEGRPYDEGAIICYDEETLDSLWSYNEPRGGFNMCLPVFEDGVMYVGTVWGEGNCVLALDTETGEVLWKNDNYGAFKMIIVGDTLYREVSSVIFAMDKTTGNDIWRTNLPNPDESPTISHHDGYLYIEHSGTLYILNANTGEQVHKMRGPDNAPVDQVSTGTGKLFVQSTQHLYAFRPYDLEKDID